MLQVAMYVFAGASWTHVYFADSAEHGNVARTKDFSTCNATINVARIAAR